jgi:hypothetical protein
MTTTPLVVVFVLAVLINLSLGYVFRPRFYLPIIITWSIVWLVYAVYFNLK